MTVLKLPDWIRMEILRLIFFFVHYWLKNSDSVVGPWFSILSPDINAKLFFYDKTVESAKVSSNLPVGIPGYSPFVHHINQKDMAPFEGEYFLLSLLTYIYIYECILLQTRAYLSGNEYIQLQTSFRRWSWCPSNNINVILLLSFPYCVSKS